MICWGKVGRALRARCSDGSENRPYLDAARSARSADPTRYNRGNPEPAAEGRTTDSRKADAPMAVTCHLIFGSYFCTFAQTAGGLHFCTYVVTRSRPYPLHFVASRSARSADPTQGNHSPDTRYSILTFNICTFAQAEGRFALLHMC
jgi:hypothetical protein